MVLERVIESSREVRVQVWVVEYRGGWRCRRGEGGGYARRWLLSRTEDGIANAAGLTAD